MSEFIEAFIISAVCGLLFGLGAFATALKAGGVLSTPDAATGAAFRIGYRQYSLSTGNALVALVALSLLCIVVVPLFIFWVQKSRVTPLEARDTPIYLKARFMPALSPMGVADDNPPSVPSLNLRFCKTSIDSTFTVSADKEHGPVVINAHYDWGQDAVVGDANGRRFVIPMNGGEQAEIPVPVPWPTIQPGFAMKSPSKVQFSKQNVRVPLDIHNLPDPGVAPQ